MNSKKVQNYIVNGSGLSTTLSNGRWLNAWFDMEDQIYRLQAGNEGLPEDYSEIHETLDSLVASMRETANLRHWTETKY